MAEEQTHRSHIRDASGPRAVVSTGDRNKPRSTICRQRDHDDRDKPRSRKSDSSRSPKYPSKKDSSRKENGHRRKHSNPRSVQSEVEAPTLELLVARQPRPVIQLGFTVGETVVLSVRENSYSGDIDRSSLFTVTSLVADTRGGERVTLEAGYLVGKKSLDSVHPLPRQHIETCAVEDPYRLSLGYSSFEDLLIRQHGTYRIRTTLMKMGPGGATTLHAVDSDPIRVERTAVQRRSQRA